LYLRALTVQCLSHYLPDEKRNCQKSASLVIELAVYSVLVTCYFFLVLNFLGTGCTGLSANIVTLTQRSRFCSLLAGRCSGYRDDAFVSLPARPPEITHVFPISNTHINPIYLVVVGFVIGILGGFFGVGGSFIAGPALRLMGVDWNYAVGTDLAHIVASR